MKTNFVTFEREIHLLLNSLFGADNVRYQQSSQKRRLRADYMIFFGRELHDYIIKDYQENLKLAINYIIVEAKNQIAGDNHFNNDFRQVVDYLYQNTTGDLGIIVYKSFGSNKEQTYNNANNYYRRHNKIILPFDKNEFISFTKKNLKEQNRIFDKKFRKVMDRID